MPAPAPEPKWRRLTVETAPCPSCERTWGSEQTLAAHLIDAHGLEAPIAARRAAEMFQAIAKAGVMRRSHRTPDIMAANSNDESEEEPPMAERPKRDTRRGGDPSKPCGYCKRAKSEHAPWCKAAGAPGPSSNRRARRRRSLTRRDPVRTKGRRPGRPKGRRTDGGDPVATAIRARIEEYQGKIRQLEAALEVMER